jgi:alpha-glucosidase
MEHADAFRFIEDVPCDWERSVLVDGRIGDYCIFARQGRGTEEWYIGGITDEEAREVAVPLTMLEEGKDYTMTLYRDAEDADWQTRPYAYIIEEKKVTAADTLRIRMAPGGGFAASLK